MADGTARERRGCLCMLFITVESGTHRSTYTRCRTHQEIAQDNRDREP